MQINGVDVIVEGDGDQTIVMIHGWPDTYRLWDAQVAYFRGQYRCIRFTLPGFDIEKARRAFSLAQTIEILRNIIVQTCAGRKVILMLHDWGCVFGYQMVMRTPSLASKIVGIDIGDAGTREYAQSLSASAKAMIFGYQIWLAIAWRIGGRVGATMTRSCAAAVKCPGELNFIDSRMNYPYYIKWTGAHGSYRDIAAAFDPPVPMLFVYGNKKPFLFHTARWADALAKRSGNEVRAMETGHWVMTERPQQFNEIVRAWLGGETGTRQAYASTAQ